MEVIINDFSLDGQFKDIDEFIDSLHGSTIPMLNVLEALKIQVLSSYNSYNLSVTNNETLHDMLKIKGSAEITRFKTKLHNLFFDEPFWEVDTKSTDNIYECEFTEEVCSYCLAEALERGIPTISFEHSDFKSSTISIKKDEVEGIISNLYNKDILLNLFREIKVITHLRYLLFKYGLEKSFGIQDNKNYFNELIEDTILSIDDVEIIVTDIEKLIVSIRDGVDPLRLTGPIDGKLKEFRTSLTNKREIRIFYFEESKKPIFLNGFLKKTETTPQREIDKAKKLMAKI